MRTSLIAASTLLLILCLLTNPAFSENRPQVDPAPTDDASEEMADKVAALEGEMREIRVAKDYFSSILSTQTVIFSTIVVVFMALTWIFSYLRVRSVVSQQTSELHAEIDEWRKAQEVAIQKRIDDRFAIARADLMIVRADVYRAFAQIQSNNPQSSYVWWLRAAAAYTDSELVRISLNGAQESLRKLRYRHHIEGEMDEIERLLARVDANRFRLELESVRAEVSRIYKNIYQPE